ncbi:multicopper oxidase domain-containing protein, partial [Streptomyces sp. SID8455]|nr:multicopper oxidase domain-containing protein [Streptomyces sp. SID8455]
VFNDMTINNKAEHNSTNFEATVGDRLEVVMITHGEYYHTFHIHGHRWADNRTGILTGPDDPSRVIDNKICGPADSFGLQFIAGERVGAGAWMYHC